MDKTCEENESWVRTTETDKDIVPEEVEQGPREVGSESCRHEDRAQKVQRCTEEEWGHM